MSYDEKHDDDAVIAKLTAAGISQELITQTRATHANWRDLLASVDAPELSPDAKNLDQLFNKFLP